MYLVIDCNDGNNYYTHFLHLTKDDIYYDFLCFVSHILQFGDSRIEKVYFSKDIIGNW